MHCVSLRTSAFAGRSGRVRGLRRLLVLFGLLSALDLFLTWQLVAGRGTLYEANPLARWLLAQYGWAGLTLFKTGAVLGVGGVCVAVARSRPRPARRVLLFGCLVLGVVVTYSGALAAWTRSAPAEHDEARQAEEHGLSLDVQVRQGNAYRALLGRLTDDLAAGRRTLLDAAAELEGSNELRGLPLVGYLRNRFPDRPTAQCLAAVLVEATLQRHPSADLASRLEAEFQAAYGAPLPPLTRPDDAGELT